jgi:hypothetical protein
MKFRIAINFIVLIKSEMRVVITAKVIRVPPNNKRKSIFANRVTVYVLANTGFNYPYGDTSVKHVM